MSLTVACVLVRGHVAFTPEYVQRLYSMARRYLDRPFRFVCLTDQCLPEFETIPIQLPPGLKGWWAKVNLWQPGLFTGRVLYLDLDSLVVSALAPIVDYPASFALVPDGAPDFHGHGKLRVVKRYNSSCMVWDAGIGTELFTQWTPDVASRLWGDQDWIGERLAHEATFPIEWFPRLSAVQPPWHTSAKVILCKKPKNVEAARRWSWFDEAWG